MVGAGALVLCWEAEGPGPVQLGQRRLQWNLTAAPQRLWGGQDNNRAEVFPAVHGKRMRDNGHELKQERFSLGWGIPFSPCGQSGGASGHSKQLCSACPWRFSRPGWIKPWAKWCVGWSETPHTLTQPLFWRCLRTYASPFCTCMATCPPLSSWVKNREDFLSGKESSWHLCTLLLLLFWM